jgi:hypothetical protein
MMITRARGAVDSPPTRATAIIQYNTSRKLPNSASRMPRNSMVAISAM